MLGDLSTEIHWANEDPGPHHNGIDFFIEECAFLSDLFQGAYRHCLEGFNVVLLKKTSHRIFPLKGIVANTHEALLPVFLVVLMSEAIHQTCHKFRVHHSRAVVGHVLLVFLL